MKKFRIKQNDLIKLNVCYKGSLIFAYLDSNFTNILDIKTFVKQKLPWNFKGSGKTVEIGIYNLTKEQSKYVNIFS
jgi:hypothetical protein